MKGHAISALCVTSDLCVCCCVCPKGERPFRCRLCPYRASQKGNLKTHVQSVHHVHFDNAQYPDYRPPGLGREQEEEQGDWFSPTTTNPPRPNNRPTNVTSPGPKIEIETPSIFPAPPQRQQRDLRAVSETPPDRVTSE